MRRPSCPVDPLEQAWIEFRLQWLSAALGPEAMRSASFVTPAQLGIADPLSAEQLPSVFERLQRIAFPTKTPVSLVFGETPFGEPDAEHARTISIPPRALSASLSKLMANLVVDVCFRRLQDTGALHGEVRSDLLAELASVYFGLAYYPANECVGRRLSTGISMEQLSVPVKQRNMTGRMFGYALALWIRARGDLDTPWLDSLRLDVREAVASSLRYLDRVGQPFFCREHLGHDPERLTRPQIESLLNHDSTTHVIIGLWQLGQFDDPGPAVFERVLQLLDHAVPEIRWTAAQALALSSDASPAIVQGLVQSLSDREGQVRASAATSLGYLRPDNQQVISQITRMLQDPDRHVAHSAGWALGRFGKAAALASRGLALLLRQSLIDCDHWSIDMLVGSLNLIVDEFEPLIPQIVKPHEKDLREMLSLALQEHRQRSDDQ